MWDRDPQQHLLLHNPQSFIKGRIKIHLAFKLTYFGKLVASRLWICLPTTPPLHSLCILMRILTEDRQNIGKLQCSWGRFKHTETPAIVWDWWCKTRAVTLDISQVFLLFFFLNFIKCIWRLGTHVNLACILRETDFLLRASWNSKHATITALPQTWTALKSNPLLRVLRINIIFIQKHCRKTAVVLVRGHSRYAHTHTCTDWHVQITIKCHAGQLKHTCTALSFRDDKICDCRTDLVHWESKREKQSDQTGSKRGRGGERQRIRKRGRELFHLMDLTLIQRNRLMTHRRQICVSCLLSTGLP